MFLPFFYRTFYGGQWHSSFHPSSPIKALLSSSQHCGNPLNYTRRTHTTTFLITHANYPASSLPTFFEKSRTPRLLIKAVIEQNAIIFSSAKNRRFSYLISALNPCTPARTNPLMYFIDSGIWEIESVRIYEKPLHLLYLIAVMVFLLLRPGR